MASVKPVPDGLRTVTPYMIFKDTAAAIDFYTRAFGAAEQFRLTSPDGHIGHAEIRIGTSTIMLADEHPAFGALSPQSVGGCPIKMHIQVPDVDAFAAHAVAEGAAVLRAVEDQFHGNRHGLLADPFGYCWFVSTQIEDVPPAEMQRRWNAVFAKQ